MEVNRHPEPMNERIRPSYLNHKNFLKVYLLLMACLFLYYQSDDEPIELYDYIDSILSTVAFFGVLAYTFEKKFLSQTFWQFYLPIYIIWIFFLTYLTGFLDRINEPLKIVLFLLIVTLIMTPMFIGLYLCGHQNVDASVKKRTKFLILTALVLLSTNATTYLLTYKDANFRWGLYDTGSKIITLELFESNASRARTFLSITINSAFFQASHEDNIERYAPLCKHLDDEIFSLLEKYQYDSNDTSRIEPMEYSGYEITQGTIEGKNRVIEMCEQIKE